MWGYGMKPKIQSIYFAKDYFPEANEYGVRTVLRELKFKVYHAETFMTLVSIIDLDPEKEYLIRLWFEDEETGEVLYTVDGSLQVARDKAITEKDGFILAEQISDLPDTKKNRCVVKVRVKDANNSRLFDSSETVLLMSKEVTPFG